jgi:hypothetical protein
MRRTRFALTNVAIVGASTLLALLAVEFGLRIA